ncbi:hypothetical protein HJ590_05175 [Naumannella sp. ID2617S]|nr:hypothetical protein [Naumannella sp. ID2617S]
MTKQVQAAYQIAFDEFERLSREGGADQPSAKMLEVEEGLYLEQDMALLQDQKKTGYKVEGKPSTSRSRAAAGAVKGDSDPRLTIQVCEDRRGSFSVNPDGRRVEDRLSEGYVYAKLVNGRVKLVNVDTSEVAQCAW